MITYAVTMLLLVLSAFEYEINEIYSAFGKSKVRNARD